MVSGGVRSVGTPEAAPDRAADAPAGLSPAAVSPGRPVERLGADRLGDLTGDQIERRLTWSEDPAAKPHSDPWGI
jgi:hypothetical protein